MTDKYNHQPVLLNEVISYLQPDPDARFIDATLGAGGHTQSLIAKGSYVLGIDQDESALKLAIDTVHSNRLIPVEANFMTIKNQAEKYKFTSVKGILFDLGVSSMQFDTPERGFSFLTTAPLDMRMSRHNPITAADIVNQSTESELYELLMTNAQEPRSKAIAQSIVANRPITTTTQLATIVSQVYRGKRGKLHPATLTFQALRIAVNQELKIIRPALKDAVDLLATNGRLVVVTFHEGEDRIVKRTFTDIVESGQAISLTKKPMIPSQLEIRQNPRARSAKLRVIERVTIK